MAPLESTARGRFGAFGGRYVPETLVPALDELERAFLAHWNDVLFREEYEGLLRDFVGRPTPLTYARNISSELGFNVILKREDLNHTGAHKINNALGQVLLALKMGKTRIIAETGAGQHGVAVATACAKLAALGQPIKECVVYMGEEDCKRQHLNVVRMQMLGAKVKPVGSGTKTLKDALNEALRDWVDKVETTHYVIGSVAGPHPFPLMVREFQKVIGNEAKEQCESVWGRLPDAGIACVGGGSNAIGFFAAFLESEVKLYGIEAAGCGLNTDRHAAPLTKGSPGVLHGSYSYLMQDADGQVMETHSVSAGLDYPGVGPEHSYLRDSGRVTYDAVTDQEALEAFQWLARAEGIIPALESAHAVAYLRRRGLFEPDSLVMVNVSGRGDKDMATAARVLGYES